MKTYAIKYVELAEQHAGRMSKRWAMDVKNNTRTKAFKEMDEESIVNQGVKFYHNFSKMFTEEKISEDALKYFRTYAQESFAMGIPMDEAVYALILLRRHIWLYAEFQTIFSSGIDQRQALDTLSRTILIFDYAAYEVTKEYQELLKSGKGRK
jgi:hypothetical protein